jgi:hypothetical protein
MRPRSVAAVLGALLLFAGCGVSSPSKNRSQTFNGTLNPGGIANHSFSSAKNGEFEFRLTAINPSRIVFLGVGLGVISNGACALTANVSSAAQVNRTAVSGAINKGDYCAVVYDPGTVTEPTSYTLTASFP